MAKREYQVCTKTIMDTSDPEITFDENGVCNHVDLFNKEVGETWFPGPEGKPKLDSLINKIKSESKHLEYDVIIGLSGGVDSSYLAYFLKKEFNLRMLAVHVDAGWNSELAVMNIENIVKILDIDLFTYVVNWKEIQDLQLAYLKSGVINQDVPQDHVFKASLQYTAKKHGIKYFLSGGNHATEGILPTSWVYRAADSRNLKAIHKKYGKVKLKTYPIAGFWKTFVYFPFIYGLKSRRPLNFIDFKKEDAKELIIKELNWRDYGGKHCESNWTKFYQNFWLPKKYGFDKRRAHLSSMIRSGEITRDEALAEIDIPLYDPHELEMDKAYVARKLGVSKEEFNAILDMPIQSHFDFKNERFLYKNALGIIRKLGVVKIIKGRLR